MNLKVVLLVSNTKEVNLSILKIKNLQKYAYDEKDNLICNLVFVGDAINNTLKNCTKEDKIIQKEIINLNVDLSVCKNALSKKGYSDIDVNEEFIPVNSGLGEAVKKQMLGYAYIKL